MLIVDDDEPLTRLWREVLEERGYRVETFTDSTRALAAFEADSDAFDAAILDLTMPRLTVDRLAQRMLAGRPDLPIFLCTGYAERLSPEARAGLGIRGIHLEPVAFDEVLTALETALDTPG